MWIQPSWLNRICVECEEVCNYNSDTLWYNIQDFLASQDVNTKEVALFINEENAFWNAPYKICILH